VGRAYEFAAFHPSAQCGILGFIVGIRASAFHDGFLDDSVCSGMVLHASTVEDGESRGKRE